MLEQDERLSQGHKNQKFTYYKLQYMFLLVFKNTAQIRLEK